MAGPNLTRQQWRTAEIAADEARRLGVRRRGLLTLLSAGLVESNLRHLGGGDRDSQGFLQQRPSQGWGAYRRGEAGIREDTRDFVRALRRTNTRGLTVGQAAQAVQRSAFPGRYQERLPEAKQILRELGGGAGGGGGGGGAQLGSLADELGPLGLTSLAGLLGQRTGPPVSGPAMPGFAAGPPMPAGAMVPQPSAAPAPKRDLLAALGQLTQGGDLGLTPLTGGGKQRGGGQRGGDVEVRGPLREMFYNGPGGINVDEGKRVGHGFVKGHTGHVHAAGQQRDMLVLGRLAEQLGLEVRENPAFDPVDPVHTRGSFHYGKREGRRMYRAIDVSDPRGTGNLLKFNRMVARAYGV